MTAFQIEDIRGFTSQLFVKETFDSFLLKEAKVVTYNSFSIDGRIRHGYFTEEELEENRIEEYSYWRTIRPICFSLIRGKRLPESFHIILKLAPKDVCKVAGQSGGAVRGEDIEGMYLNIRYENRELACITGLTMKTFTMDKTMDGLWDETVKEFFRSKGIV